MPKSSANARFLNRGFQRSYLQQIKAHPLAWIIGVSILFFFLCSSLRHALFNSTGWDLGIFDQVVYLISQGQPPISSFIHVHILGDHAAWLFYPLALLYKIYPNVHWLFLVQSTVLALGALPTWHLARLAGLRKQQAIALSIVYLFYPVIFNANLFDFHPEVIAVPALFTAILAARLGQILWFCLATIVVLGCKFILALTVAALGLWLLVFEKKHLYGAIAIFAGITWFLLATKVILPTFNPQQITSLSRYGYLGPSIPEIAKNLFLKPEPIFKVLLSLDNLKYLVLVFAPIIWGLSLRNLAPLIPALPTLALNLLADYQPQKDIVAQYSLPLVPFLIIAVIATLAEGRGWLQDSRKFILWSLIFFLGLARWSYFFTKYLPTIDTWQATREAIALVQTQGGVYTTNEISPHLSHRPLIERTVNTESQNITQFEYVLLNQRHPGSNSSPEFAATLIEQLQQIPPFRLRYQKDGVFLFQKATH